MVSSGNAVLRFEVRLLVQYRFIDGLLMQLDMVRCSEVSRLSQQGIEYTEACTDDVLMSAKSRATLLEYVNALLAALETQCSESL
jgi:hypothetical protein